MSYTVKRGDTLSEIARVQGTTVEAILEANPDITNPDLILEGQKLNMPPTATSPGRQEGLDGFSYTVKSGDTLYQIVREQYGTHHSDARLRGLVEMVTRENGLSNPDKLEVGQRLWLPRAE